MADSPEQIKKAMKLYTFIGGCLFVGTILTVAVAVFEPFDVGARGFSMGDLVIGLAIASVKASLVLLIFMHMNSEKKLIYLYLIFAVLGAVALFLLTALAFADPIQYDGFFSGKAQN